MKSDPWMLFAPTCNKAVSFGNATEDVNVHVLLRTTGMVFQYISFCRQQSSKSAHCWCLVLCWIFVHCCALRRLPELYPLVDLCPLVELKRLLDHGILGPHSVALELQHFLQFSRFAEIVPYQAQSARKERTQNRKRQVRHLTSWEKTVYTSEKYSRERNGTWWWGAEFFKWTVLFLPWQRTRKWMMMIRVGSVGKLDRSASNVTWNKCQRCGRLHHELRVAAPFRIRAIFDRHCPNQRSQAPSLSIMTLITPLYLEL